MAKADRKVVPFKRQPELPPRRSLADQMNDILMLLNVAEQLPILSNEILKALANGEPHTDTVWKFQTLHLNIQELAELSAKAKFMPLKGY